MKQQRNFSAPRQQRGAVLIVSMLLLLVITILALGASQATRLQERLSGSQRNFELAFQAAEAGLRAGERMIDADSMAAPPLPCSAITNPVCQVYENNFLTDVYAKKLSYEAQVNAPDEWWEQAAQPYSNAATPEVGSGSIDPSFYIEEVEEVPDSLTVPPNGPPPSRVFYRIVSRGKGGTANANVVLHSTYVRRFN